MAYLTLKGVNKIYPNGFHAVHDFNLSVEQGEFIVFVGSSGCGKSTTLRMIAGLEEISKGELLIEGRLANSISPRERKVAMVFQSYALYPQMSVYDNLAFGLELQGVDEDVIDERVTRTAAILGLSDYLDRMPRALSGGQRQRVAVGRAIIRKAGLFLMDEPLSNLDAKQRVTMRSEIAQIHRETGATTIYVTHDQVEAMTLADRIVIMRDGFIVQVGTPFELYFKPESMFVAGFIGEPPMNFVSVSVQNGKISLFGAEVDLQADLGFDPAPYEGGRLVLGFRPEAVMEGDCPNSAVVSASVELTELLGDSTNVYVTMDSTNAILKIDPHAAPSADDTFTFSVPFASVYLFDETTEKTVRMPDCDEKGEAI